jgi:hypothetical protein
LAHVHAQRAVVQLHAAVGCQRNARPGTSEPQHEPRGGGARAAPQTHYKSIAELYTLGA